MSIQSTGEVRFSLVTHRENMVRGKEDPKVEDDDVVELGWRRGIILTARAVEVGMEDPASEEEGVQVRS